jgi:hypothetical protein
MRNNNHYTATIQFEDAQYCGAWAANFIKGTVSQDGGWDKALGY